MTRPVEVRVETLVLDGVAQDQREAVGKAFAAELGRLLASGAAASTDGAARGGGTTVPVAGGDPARLGSAIAQAVHRRLPAAARRGGHD